MVSRSVHVRSVLGGWEIACLVPGSLGVQKKGGDIRGVFLRSG